MKKVWPIMLCTLLCTSFAGCAKSDTALKVSSALASSHSVSAASQKQDSSGAAAKKDLPENKYKDFGNGSFSISTPSGTSENGNVPIVYYEKDDGGNYGIGFSARDFDGSKLSYEYIDGYLIGKEQIANEDSSIYAGANNLESGKHKVEIVQYDTNEPTGKMVMYKSAFYEVKPK